MDFLSLAWGRKSVRSFQDAPVANEDILKLMMAAQLAPSAGNRQPWHFYVVTNKEVQQDIVDRCCKQPFMLTAPLFIVVCADASKNEDRYGQRGKELYCIQDTAAAIQNILLCARDLGLGSCWCGAFDEAVLAEILQMEATLRPVAIIPIGHPTAELDARPRRPLEDIVTFIE